MTPVTLAGPRLALREAELEDADALLAIYGDPEVFPREPSTPARPDGPTAFDWAVVPAVRGQLDDPDPAWLERMGRITVPTLVGAGGSRSHLPQDWIAELAWQLPDCRIVTVEAGHMVHNVLPDEFTRVVVAFLRPAVEQAAGGRAPRPPALGLPQRRCVTARVGSQALVHDHAAGSRPGAARPGARGGVVRVSDPALARNRCGPLTVDARSITVATVPPHGSGVDAA
ncbi:hypothetical protein ACIG5E_38615 [Kitasatospora sp. NPDC053057]|uniref:hypothetical protein n=1 Tax=Kitasatospora sp. NPDC053057 TaxID=3364062 RepID=UPI0037CB7A86